MLFDSPPPDEITIHTIVVAIIAAIVTLVTPVITIAGTILVTRTNRDEDRKDRMAVAMAVEKVAEDVKVSNDERSEQLGSIKATTDATHAIVNNQRTVMLRALAVSMRTIAELKPDDRKAQEAATLAEKDLADNVRENADPATKVTK